MLRDIDAADRPVERETGGRRLVIAALTRASCIRAVLHARQRRWNQSPTISDSKVQGTAVVSPVGTLHPETMASWDHQWRPGPRRWRHEYAGRVVGPPHSRIVLALACTQIVLARRWQPPGNHAKCPAVTDRPRSGQWLRPLRRNTGGSRSVDQ